MGCLEAHFFSRIDELIFKFKNALTGVQSGLQFCRMTWLGKVIVRASLKAGHYIFSQLFGG